MTNIRFKDYLLDYLITNNISNVEFAKRLGISRNSMQQILSGESGISSDTIEKISIITNIPVDFIYEIEKDYNFEKSINDYLEKENISLKKYRNRFNYNQLKNMKWLEFLDEASDMEIVKDILKFLRVPSPEEIYKIDTNLMYKSKNDKQELLVLWLEKCYRETLKQSVNEYNSKNLGEIANFILLEARENKFDKKQLTNFFNENGIYLVIQNDIPTSKIRGAFKVHRDKPAIYLTLKHKRIADIYFALLHELAHCKTDFNSAKSKSYICLESKKDDIDTEIRADNQAYFWMLNNRKYNKVLEGYKEKGEIPEDIPKSFFVYVLAKEKEIPYDGSLYQTNNPVIDSL